MNKKSSVLYEVVEQVATITLNNAERRNALDFATLDSLKNSLERAADDPNVRVIVIAGAGQGFCAGADLTSSVGRLSAEEIIEHHYKPTFMTIAEMEKPVMAAVNGAAAGAGCALALVCDLVMMADDAYFLLSFSNLGLIPDCGANWLLARSIGAKRAYELAIEGERINASHCLELGLVNRLVGSADLMGSARRWGHQLARRAPLSLGLTKKVMRESFTASYSEIFSMEGSMQDICLASSDFHEGISAFYEKRQPEFRGL